MSPYAYLPMLTHLVCLHTLTYHLQSVNSEPPDQGLFRYDPDSIHFTIDPRHNSIRDACGIGGGPTCRGELPVLGNRPRSKDLATAFTYTHEGAGGATTKPCIDTFCRDQKVDSSSQ